MRVGARVVPQSPRGELRCAPVFWSAGPSCGLGLAALADEATAALRGLWAPDEPRYAEVAREVFEGGSWTVLRRCGEIYADKPPLFFWTAGLLGWMSGWSVPAMRLVSLASIAVLAWLTARFARRAWGEREARWAPLLLLGFLMVIELRGRLQIDPLLAALCTGAIVFFDEAREGERAQRKVLAAGFLLGLAGFAKGPIVWAMRSG